MASEFYLVLPSNSSMITHPNNTLAQYITNLPRRINISGVWECGLTEIHYPHDWYNVRNARLTVEHDGNMETDVCFEDGYYHSPEALATTLNGDKPGRVKFAYEPVTQKFIALVKSKTKFTLYGDLPDILGFGAWSGDSTTSLTSSARSMFVRRHRSRTWKRHHHHHLSTNTIPNFKTLLYKTGVVSEHIRVTDQSSHDTTSD